MNIMIDFRLVEPCMGLAHSCSFAFPLVSQVLAVLLAQSVE